MVTAADAALLLLLYRRRKRKVRRPSGIHAVNRLRNVHGAYFTMFTELKKDPDRFKRYMRMDLARFEKLLDMLRPRLVF